MNLKFTDKLTGPFLRLQAGEREGNRRHTRAALRDLIQIAQQCLNEKVLARGKIPIFLRKKRVGSF